MNLPATLSACGDYDGAVEACESLVSLSKRLGKEVAMHVKFNLANYLIEQACFSALDDSQARVKLRARIQKLVRECKPLERKDPGAFADLRAMVEVALSDDAAVLRKAIDQIYSAIHNPKGCPKYAKAYAELHLRIAWRRLLELEAR